MLYAGDIVPRRRVAKCRNTHRGWKATMGFSVVGKKIPISDICK
jgi:hypothetical protein